MLKSGRGTKCHKHCHQSISADQREKLFQDFWKLGNLSNQREYLLRHVRRKPVRSNISASSKRAKKCSFNYGFLVNDQLIQVCKIFFLHTLAISDQMLLTTFQKLNENGHVQPERRSLPAARKLPSELRNHIRDHINKYPVVDSHYCRKSTQKKYLDPGLNLTEMYRMYCEECSASGRPAAKKWAYDEVFHNEFNLGFHRPKKDQCDFCVKYKNLDESGRDKIRDKMEEHEKNKTLARELKHHLKEQAKTDRNMNVACFDLQQVLLTPHSMSSQLFYRRKLSTFNLTIFDIASKSGYCCMWHEGVGKRGANNVASCIMKYIRHMNEKSKEFHFFTDNCCGQNKNKVLTSMYFHAVKTLNIDRICHYYLEKGHTENEGDSMHSTIETAAKNVNIVSPIQWYTVAGTAKKTGERYTVWEMEGQMTDFRGLAESPGSFKCSQLRWTDIKCLKVEKNHPHSLFVKTSFACEDYKEIQFVSKQVGDQSDSNADIEGEEGSETEFDELPALEPESLVTTAKKKDLLWMCEELIIPSSYDSFYKNLACVQTESLAVHMMIHLVRLCR